MSAAVSSLKIKNKLKTPVDAAEEIYDLAISHRAETESSRRIASAIVERLSDLSLFKMGLPKSLGGLEDNPRRKLKGLRAISQC